MEGAVVGLPLPGLGSEAASRRPPGDHTGMGVCLQKRTAPLRREHFLFPFSLPFLSLPHPFPSLSSLLLSQLWDLETLLTQIGEKKKETHRGASLDGGVEAVKLPSISVLAPTPLDVCVNDLEGGPGW